MARKVLVRGVPGYTDEFRATVIPGMDDLPAVDDRGPLAIICTEVDDLHVVPAACLKDVEDDES